MKMLVLDTNIVLDLFLFNDPTIQSLKSALQAGSVRWLATTAMREELKRVLGYPKIGTQLTRFQLNAEQVMTCFDRHIQIVTESDPVKVTCSDADDQKFIDLAVELQAQLISKDAAILSLAKSLAALGVQVQSSWMC